MMLVSMQSGVSMSLPVWECGLKYYIFMYYKSQEEVTPCVGVWIEMALYLFFNPFGTRHSLCGSVD